jgi:ATP-dependent HslUV protease ATP-binding subunit HslU
MASLSQAPFIKVEATKFTEVGFHGRDVDQIIRDLLDISITLTKKLRTEKLKDEVQQKVEDRILDTLVGEHAREDSRQSFRLLLRQGNLDDREIEIEMPNDKSQGGSAIAFDPSGGPMAVNDLIGKLGRMVGPKKAEKKKMPISEARPLIEEIELEKMLDMTDITKEAITAAEENGIVFIDEIDKICNSGDYRGADASAEGVQRDLLPIIEGSTISTKHGNVNTDHILFVASGAFHSCKPSDLLAELQVCGGFFGLSDSTSSLSRMHSGPIADPGGAQRLG